MIGTPKIDYFSLSEIGNRKLNEDSVVCLCDGKKYMFVVADGLGGYDEGEVASAYVTEYIANYFYSPDFDEKYLYDLFINVNNALIEKQKECSSSGMKTTLSILYISGNTVKRAYIGDSRIYRFTKKGEYEKTLDHSSAQLLVLSGDITDEEIRFNPERNKLLKALGDERTEGRPEILPDIKCRKGDSFLLCTDGFWEYITEDQMKTCLAGANDSKDWLGLMADIVRANGIDSDMDNFSAIGVFVR